MRGRRSSGLIGATLAALAAACATFAGLGVEHAWATAEEDAHAVTDAVTDTRTVADTGRDRPSHPPLPRDERTQFVLMGMDTTPHWERRGFEDLYRYINLRRRPGQEPYSYTLFIGSGGLQLDEARRDLTDAERVFQGIPPRHSPVFDYAESLAQIRGKAENIRRLHALGVEIGSHTVRHLDGSAWSRAEWDRELDDHARILALAGLPQPAGFRAPFLGRNEAMYASLAAHGYVYDASETQNARRWPSRRPGTRLWQFGIPSVSIPGRDRPVLFFDLNMEQRLRRAARAEGVEGEAETVAWIEDAYFEIAMAEFQRRYRGSRAPFLVSGHGGFRDAISRFMRRVCRMEQVRCATFSEAVAYLEAHPEMEGAE
ncbi:MAG: hypothetical protein OHK0013_45970 [Sandaracinaceae bacterium]